MERGSESEISAADEKSKLVQIDRIRTGKSIGHGPACTGSERT